MESILSSRHVDNLPLESACRFGVADSKVDGDPFHENRIQAQAERAVAALELSLMKSRLESSIAGTVELFCLLAEHSPELLPGPWATVADVIASEERLWVYPCPTVGEVDDGHSEAFVPYLNRTRLAAEWPRLLEHASRVHACRESGKAHGYEA